MIKKTVYALAQLVLPVGVAVLLLGADHRLSEVEAGVLEAAAAPFEVGFMPSEYIGDGCVAIAGGCSVGGTAVCCADDTCFPGTYIKTE